MRKAILIVLLAAICLLGGCGSSAQVEDQAYVIAMGIDRTDDGGIELSVQIPKISGGQDSSGSSASSGSYLPLSITAPDYEQAMERLSWAVPRVMNLTQLEMIVISRDLAEDTAFRELLRQIAGTGHIFAAADVVICEGDAKAFIEALRPVLGTRLSADLQAGLDHYRSIGIIPDCSLASLYYLSNSVYGDPMAAYAILEKSDKTKNEAQQASSSLAGSISSLSESHESEIEPRYLGAAVFSSGAYCGILDGRQTILANLITNSLDSFRYICGGESMEFSQIGDTKIRVDTHAEPAKISIGIRLSIEEHEDIPDEQIMRETLIQDMLATINAARAMNADPFGFAEAAAGNFLTLEDWINYDWKRHYQDAQIEIKLRFSRTGT